MSAFANNTLRFGLPAGSPWRARSRVARGSGHTTQRTLRNRAEINSDFGREKVCSSRRVERSGF